MEENILTTIVYKQILEFAQRSSNTLKGKAKKMKSFSLVLTLKYLYLYW